MNAAMHASFLDELTKLSSWAHAHLRLSQRSSLSDEEVEHRMSSLKQMVKAIQKSDGRLSDGSIIPSGEVHIPLKSGHYLCLTDIMTKEDPFDTIRTRRQGTRAGSKPISKSDFRLLARRGKGKGGRRKSDFRAYDEKNKAYEFRKADKGTPHDATAAARYRLGGQVHARS